MELPISIILPAIAVIFVLYFWYRTQKKPVPNFPPGPIGLPIVGYMPFLYPNSHLQFGPLGKKYGPISSMKIGPYWLIVLNNYETIKKALVKDVFSGRPQDMIGMRNIRNGIGYNQGNDWFEQRKFIVKNFNTLSFGQDYGENCTMEQYIGKKAEEFVNRVRNEVCFGKTVNMEEFLLCAALQMSIEMILGIKMDINDNEFQKIKEMFIKGFMYPKLIGPAYFLPWLANLAPGFTKYDEFKSSIAGIKVLLRDAIKKHRTAKESASGSTDLLDLYMDKMKRTEDPASSFYDELGRENVIDTFANLILANTVTFTSTLSFSLLYLTSNQNAQNKIQAEIALVTDNVNRQVSMEDKQRMPYTEAAMHETYRLSSIAPGAAIHSVKEDTTFMGYNIPKGTLIHPNLYQVHHDQDVWGMDAEEFKPERFLDPENGSFIKNENVIPFSVGKRACPGERIGRTENFIFLTTLLQNFSFKEDPNYPLPGFEADSSFVLYPKQFKAVLVERDHSKLAAAC